MRTNLEILARRGERYEITDAGRAALAQHPSTDVDEVADAWKLGENHYRQTVLGQGPLPGYPTVARHQ